MKNRETRYLNAERLHLTTEQRDGGKKVRSVRGYAAVFDSWSEDLGGFREKIAPGAFARTLEEREDVRALWNHDANFPLGRTTAGTLRLKEDEAGLAIEIDLPSSSVGDMVAEAIERGDVSQMSFGFNVRSDEWQRGEDGAPHERTLNDIELFEVSPVTFPAYPDTEIAMRSLEAFEHVLKNDAEIEAILAEERDGEGGPTVEELAKVVDELKALLDVRTKELDKALSDLRHYRARAIRLGRLTK